MPRPLPLALAATMLLAACNQPTETTDNAQVDVANASEPDNAALESEPVVEDAADAAPVTIVAVPTPAAGATAADTAPLKDAAAIETAIRSGKDIQRVRHGEGWAWMRGGKIVRTADRDGRDVAYFRDGADKPFFVQKGDRSYAYKDGKPTRTFDDKGKGQIPDPDRSRDAEKAAGEARQQREQADHAREQHDAGRDRNGKPARTDDRQKDGGKGKVMATPTPPVSPPHERGPRAGDERGDRDRH